ncbi:response regulator [Streptomyces sp. NBC_01386]|uniref:response regulator n=1 Tax=Streptomyces sp. NBC_01386 TaxID=2903848 RepID=UPI00386D9C54
MRVLVVEDEIRTAELLRRGLTEEGYAVDVAVDGPEAVWQAAEVPYDLIVLDVMLPGFDGFEVCRRLRADDCWAPVLVLTALGSVGERVQGLDAGADDYSARTGWRGQRCARWTACADGLRRSPSRTPEHGSRHPPRTTRSPRSRPP